MLKSLWVFIPSALLFFLSVPACRKESASGPSMLISDTVTTITNATGKSYLALGDSYTIGQSVPATDRFPYLTASTLHSQGLNVQEPRYIATTGWTTIDLQTAINLQNPSPNYDIVTLLIGVNDQYQHRDTADYRVRFTQLLDKAIVLAGNHRNHVFVLSIPDYGATPFVMPSYKATVSAEVAWFNAINKQITLQYNIAYVDITPLTLEVTSDASLLASDNLHYSGREHQKWADLLAPVIRNSF